MLPTLCLTLDRRTFARVMGPLEDILKVNTAHVCSHPSCVADVLSIMVFSATCHVTLK